MPDFRWLVARGAAIDIEPTFAFSTDASGSDQEVSAEGGPDSVRGHFLQQFSGIMPIHCLAHFFFPHAKTSFQFFFTSVPLQRTASYRSVMKDSQQALVCSSGAARQHIVGCIVSTVQHSLRLQLRVNFVCLCLSLRLVVRAGQANRALTIEVHTHRFLHVHSPNNSSYVEAPTRVPHDATECEGEVLNPCRAQEMTVSDTVCCSNVLCRSICHRSTQCVLTRVGAGFRSTLRFSRWSSGFRAIAFTIARAL